MLVSYHFRRRRHPIRLCKYFSSAFYHFAFFEREIIDSNFSTFALLCLSFTSHRRDEGFFLFNFAAKWLNSKIFLLFVLQPS